MSLPARVRPRDRVRTETDKKAAAQPVKFPAPVGGWAENTSLAINADGLARVAENVFFTTQGVRVRGGAKKAAKIGARCYSLFTYKTAASAKMFATSATAIYDVSGLNPNSVPSASVSSLTSGYFSTEQIGTVGGEYLYAVNGSDKPRLYDGSTWTAIDGASTPAITGVTTTTLSWVWKHKSRLWFVQKNTKDAWYLPVDSIGGAAAKLSLAGIFQKGGALMFGTTWSQESGDGPNDRCVFVSTEGEVAVYQGSNPASATDWALVGLYNIPKPRGGKCAIRAGGDVIIGTEAGLMSLAAVVAKDPAALDASAVSAKIEPSWRSEGRRWDSVQPWEILKWPRENMMLVSLPHTTGTAFVANLQTGAFSKYIGWDVQCTCVHNDQGYFANKAGDIFAMETGGQDNGSSYVARLSYMPTDLGSPATFKTVGAMRGTFMALREAIVQLSITSDYGVTFPALPEATAFTATGSGVWDSGTWDAALWDDDGLSDYIVRPVWSTGWRSVGATGYALAPQFQAVVNGSGRPTLELIQIDAMGEVGGAVG